MSKINKELLPMKAHYFFFNAGTSPVVPFMPTLARQLGFSSVVVGIMYTILPVVGMLTKPLFGFIADRYQKHRMLFLLAQALTAISFFCIMFVPAIPEAKRDFFFHCHQGVSELKYCSKFDPKIVTQLENHYGNETLGCSLRCKADSTKWEYMCKNWLNMSDESACPKHDSHIELNVFVNMARIIQEEKCMFFNIAHDQGEFNGMNFTFNCPDSGIYKSECEFDCHDKFIESQFSEITTIPNSEVTGLYQFWVFFTLLIASWAGMAVVVSVGDAICFALLGDRHHLYGNQRLWGAVGFGIFSLLSGVLVDAMSGGSANKDYTIIFWITAIMIGVDMFASTKLKKTTTKISTNILKDVGKMFLSFRIVLFFVWCIQVGLCTALIWNFLFWHLEVLDSEYNTNPEGNNSMKTLQGLAMAIQCFGGELPFFFLSGYILKKIGHIHAMSLVLFGFGVRFLLYSFLTNPWWVLPIELLNGVTFGIFYSTMASYASIVAPTGTEATLQGLVGAIFEGIGVSIGSFLGGLLMDQIGGAETFRIFGICALCSFVLHALIHWQLQKRSNPNGAPNYLNPTDAIYMLNDQEYNVMS